MKIRSGFVSNSSSSSFVVLLPDDFNIENIDFENDKIKDLMEEDTNTERVKNKMLKLLKQQVLWTEECYREFYAISEILKPYTIMSIDSGPDDGKIILADKKKIKKVLGME